MSEVGALVRANRSREFIPVPFPSPFSGYECTQAAGEGEGAPD